MHIVVLVRFLALLSPCVKQDELNMSDETEIPIKHVWDQSQCNLLHSRGLEHNNNQSAYFCLNDKVKAKIPFFWLCF